MRELTRLCQTGGVPLALRAKLSIGETFIVMGWREHANAAFAVFPPLVKGCVRIPIHSVKVGVDTLIYDDADRHTESGSSQRHRLSR